MASAASAWPRWSSIIAPDQIWPIGLAMPLPAMSGAEPCTGSNIDGNSRSGLRLADGAMPIVPVTAGPEVGEDVAEQVRADDDVEPVGVQHEVRGEDVDVVLVGPDVRILRGHRPEALVPVRHGDRDAVRLGRRGHVLLRAASSPARRRSAGCGRRRAA